MTTRTRPWWIVAAAVVIAAAYVPTLATPFDFIDDGNLVYPVAGKADFGDHVELWWRDVESNYEALGAFRPTLWAHWHIVANTLDADPVAWRMWRLAWCALATGMLLWLMRELGVHPIAAVLATAAAMWNPYRNEVWMSLTLGEGVAMPYALFALIAARRAATASRAWPWDIAAILAVLVALGCKNTFAAIIPVQVMLRMWPDGISLREAWKANGWRALALTITAAFPIAHYIHFKAHWHAGQYETHSPSVEQLVRMLSALRGAMSQDFLGAGFVFVAVALWAGLRATGASVGSGVRHAWNTHRGAFLCAGLLLAFGIGVYLPMSAISGRYTMPAVWGLDILFGLALTALIHLPKTRAGVVAWFAVGTGLLVVLVACEARQAKFAARAVVLNEALNHIERTAPPNSVVEWECGDPMNAQLTPDEGVHFRWHLERRSRSDIGVVFVSPDGKPIEQIEMDNATGVADYRVSTNPPPEQGWEVEHTAIDEYAFGRKYFRTVVSRKTETTDQSR